MGAAMAPLNVEIWSDVVCPWCYIGKRRFEAAVERFDGDVDVTWRSFELDPGAPPVREHTATEHLAAKYGMSREQAETSHAQMTELAAQEGLEYHFELARGGNSFDAHRLTHLAATQGLQDDAMERIMRGYFTEGVAIGDREALIELAAEIGLDAREALEGDEYADAVREDEELARRIGIQGVPFFVLDRRYGVSGAQPAEQQLAALERAWAEREPVAERAGG
jgi:predicted DsbA family dithiol-disulfide isomerase